MLSLLILDAFLLISGYWNVPIVYFDIEIAINGDRVMSILVITVL